MGMCQTCGSGTRLSRASTDSGASYQNTATHRNHPNFNKVPTTAFVSGDEAILDNGLRNLSTKSISAYEALQAALATDHILINCILSLATVSLELLTGAD